MTDQQSAEVYETPEELAQRIETLEARLLQLVEGHAIQELTQRIETLTRERDEWKHEAESRGEWEQNGPAYLDRAEAAEAQRDRLAEALRQVQKANGELPDPESYEAIESICRAALSEIKEGER